MHQRNGNIVALVAHFIQIVPRFAKLLRRSRSSTLLIASELKRPLLVRELIWRPRTEHRAGLDAVVRLLLDCNLSLRFEQVTEPACVQALIA